MILVVLNWAFITWYHSIQKTSFFTEFISISAGFFNQHSKDMLSIVVALLGLIPKIKENK